MFQSTGVLAQKAEDSMAIKYGRGGPNRRRRKEELEEVPPRFDLDLVGTGEPVYLPGGLPKALEGAERNSAHPMKGQTWNLTKSMGISPGVWVLHWTNMYGARWLLVYETGMEFVTVVDREGGYVKMSRPDARLTFRDVASTPPWWDEWVEAFMDAQARALD